RTIDGRLWFPTSRGLAVVDPKAKIESSSPLAAYILEVLAEGNPLDQSRPGRLAARTGRLEIRYTALHLAAPERLSYSYRLEGVDAGWVQAGNRQSTTYNNLRHGSYRFVVSAQVSGGPARESSYSFVILPHFYETAWFV